MIKNKKEIQSNEVFAQGLQSDIASEQLNDILGKDIAFWRKKRNHIFMWIKNLAGF